MGGHIDVQCILKCTQLKKQEKKSRKCLQLCVCTNCNQICGSSEQLKPNLHTWQRNAVDFLHPNPCLSQSLNSAQTFPFIRSVGGNLKSAGVYLVSAAHNSRSQATSCSVMVLVYFRILSPVTFQSSPMLHSSAVGHSNTTLQRWSKWIKSRANSEISLSSNAANAA